MRIARTRPRLACVAASVFSLAGGCKTQKEIPKPGVPEVQVSFASLRPIATFKIGATADWVLVTDNAVWVAASAPYSVVRIDPAANTIVARVNLPGEACSGLASGLGSIWVPICGKPTLLVRVDAATNTLSAKFPVGPAGPEGGIAAGGDSVWIMTDERGTLSRIDPATGVVRQKITISPGSYNPIFDDGIIWVTGFESNVLTAVDALSGVVLESIPVGPKPRFLTAGAGSIWTLNQGDGSLSRVDSKSRRLVATIRAGVPGHGGDIGFGGNAVWATVIDIPLSRIDPATNRVTRQWTGSGGDSVRFGHNAIWLTDYSRGLLWRIPQEVVTQP